MTRVNIVVVEEDLNRSFILDNGHYYRTNCNTLYDAKQSVVDIIWQSIELDELIGSCLVVAEYEENGKYLDKDIFLLQINKVSRTNEPSKFINWGDKKPRIFAIDKDNTVIINEATGERFN